MEESKCDLMERIYLLPGNKVRVNKLTNAPEMMVVRKKELTFKDGDEKTKTLQGMVCRWFTSDGMLLEATWNTKDLSLID